MLKEYTMCPAGRLDKPLGTIKAKDFEDALLSLKVINDTFEHECSDFRLIVINDGYEREEQRLLADYYYGDEGDPAKAEHAAAWNRDCRNHRLYGVM
jgi:hypothetical protein